MAVNTSDKLMNLTTHGASDEHSHETHPTGLATLGSNSRRLTTDKIG